MATLQRAEEYPYLNKLVLDDLELDVIADSMESLLEGNLDDETARGIYEAIRGPLT